MLDYYSVNSMRVSWRISIIFQGNKCAYPYKEQALVSLSCDCEIINEMKSEKFDVLLFTD